VDDRLHGLKQRKLPRHAQRVKSHHQTQLIRS
jgi:hypothetical protein